MQTGFCVLLAVLACVCCSAAGGGEQHDDVIRRLKGVIVEQKTTLEAQAQILESMQQEPRMSQRATPHMQALPVNRTLQHGGPERLFYLKHFMSPEEVNLMLTAAMSRFERSTTFGGKDLQDQVGSLVRSSSTAYLTQEDYEKVQPIVERMHAEARIPYSNGEALQVTRYDAGQLYQFHWDSQCVVPRYLRACLPMHCSCPPHPLSLALGRYATFLVFLNDVEQGGHTVFPQAQWVQSETARQWAAEHLGLHLPELGSPAWDTSDLPSISTDYMAEHPSMEPFCAHPAVVRFPPRAGDALLWFNHDMQLDHDWHTLHGGCPPLGSSRKYIAQQWMRWYRQDGEEDNDFYAMLQECGFVEQDDPTDPTKVQEGAAEAEPIEL